MIRTTNILCVPVFRWVRAWRVHREQARFDRAALNAEFRATNGEVLTQREIEMYSLPDWCGIGPCGVPNQTDLSLITYPEIGTRREWTP